MRKLEINAPVLLLGIFMLPYIANAPLAIFSKHIVKGALILLFLIRLLYLFLQHPVLLYIKLDTERDVVKGTARIGVVAVGCIVTAIVVITTPVHARVSITAIRAT